MYEYHQSPSRFQHSWSCPAMRAAGQTHQTLEGISHQNSFHGQVYHSPYYHVDDQSQHVMQAVSPHPGPFYASFWNAVPPFPHGSKHSHPYYSHSEYPSSPPNLFQYLDPFRPSPQCPLPYTNGNHTGIPRQLHHDHVPNADSTRKPKNKNPGVLRGPPRKPRQSGHALWVGNLPFSTDIMKLKDHFSTAATATIESVFWITKSKSAFVNYRTGEALLDAMNRFHDSKFEGVRLVCRVRSTGISSPTVSVTAVRAGDDTRRGLSQAAEGSPVETAKGELSSPESLRASEVNMKAPPENNAKKRFFIMKSLAKEDLESSVLNGHWVTQEHNEMALNEAFVCADDVYLIFSANKSGGYFGYARMQSLIPGHSPRLRPTRPTEEVSKNCESDLPEIVFTPGTEFAPEGAVFIDAYRGTIFWEADSASQDKSSSKLSTGGLEAKADEESADPAKDKEWNLSSPFEVKWITTNRLPFHRTKGLQNPWNANRDVKVARDGTELETNLGIRLLELFHQTVPPTFWDPNGWTSVGYQTLSPA